MRWVEPDKYHVTFRFLGDFEAEKLPDLFRSVERATLGPPPVVTVSGIGAFRKRGVPRVWWVGASGERFSAIKSMLDEALRALCGVDPESRPFRSHVTIGRVKRRERARGDRFPPRGEGHGGGGDRFQVPDLYAGTFTLPELVVVESELGPGGPRYTTRYTAIFRDEGADQETGGTKA